MRNLKLSLLSILLVFSCNRVSSQDSCAKTIATELNDAAAKTAFKQDQKKTAPLAIGGGLLDAIQGNYCTASVSTLATGEVGVWTSRHCVRDRVYNWPKNNLKLYNANFGKAGLPREGVYLSGHYELDIVQKAKDILAIENLIGRGLPEQIAVVSFPVIKNILTYREGQILDSCQSRYCFTNLEIELLDAKAPKKRDQSALDQSIYAPYRNHLPLEPKLIDFHRQVQQAQSKLSFGYAIRVFTDNLPQITESTTCPKKQTSTEENCTRIKSKAMKAYQDTFSEVARILKVDITKDQLAQFLTDVSTLETYETEGLAELEKTQKSLAQYVLETFNNAKATNQKLFVLTNFGDRPDGADYQYIMLPVEVNPSATLVMEGRNVLFQAGQELNRYFQLENSDSGAMLYLPGFGPLAMLAKVETKNVVGKILAQLPEVNSKVDRNSIINQSKQIDALPPSTISTAQSDGDLNTNATEIAPATQTRTQKPEPPATASQPQPPTPNISDPPLADAQPMDFDPPPKSPEPSDGIASTIGSYDPNHSEDIEKKTPSSYKCVQ